MVVQWLRLHASSAEGSGSIPGQGTKIPQALWCGMKEQNEVIKKKNTWVTQYFKKEIPSVNPSPTASSRDPVSDTTHKGTSPLLPLSCTFLSTLVQNLLSLFLKNFQIGFRDFPGWSSG